jgi:hypothetical protein
MDKGDTATVIDEIESKIQLLHDPYDSQNPFKIVGEIPPDKEFPAGQVLGWKNPRFRGRRGWRGWKLMEWDDEYAGKDGEFLHNYLADPPEKLTDPAYTDNYVRRGDSILGRLDKRIFVSRMLKMQLDCAKNRGSLSDDEEISIGEGIKIVGTGMTEDMRPRQVEKRKDKVAHPAVSGIARPKKEK